MDELKFPKKEPEKYDRRSLQLGMKIETWEHICWSTEKKHYDNFNSVPKKTRDEVLECFRKGGITIGETAEKFGLSSEVIGDIIYLNIKDIPVLRGESL